MPIVWRDQISVGNDAIDQDHKYFIREEEIQKKARCPDINEHKREHEDILVKLADLEQLDSETLLERRYHRLMNYGYC